MNRIKTAIAAGLLMVSGGAVAHPDGDGFFAGDHRDKISQEEIEQRAEACVAWKTSNVSTDTIIDAYKLEDWRDAREFDIGCRLLIYGMEVGIEVSKMVNNPNI